MTVFRIVLSFLTLVTPGIYPVQHIVLCPEHARNMCASIQILHAKVQILICLQVTFKTSLSPSISS